MSDKIKIEISQKAYEKIKSQYELGIASYEKLGIKSVDEFISYVLENFANSTTEFEKLSDQMKSMIENIDIDKLNFEDIFKNIANLSPKKDDESPKEPEKET
ncbi:MAG: hypothetical protein RR201_02995, partial [Malacoplasma sp.]